MQGENGSALETLTLLGASFAVGDRHSLPPPRGCPRAWPCLFQGPGPGLPEGSTGVSGEPGLPLTLQGGQPTSSVLLSPGRPEGAGQPHFLDAPQANSQQEGDGSSLAKAPNEAARAQPSLSRGRAGGESETGKRTQGSGPVNQ